ncbi:hypothetical protein CU044_6848 [Streptomyces sp. L-9-10]|nr:hypothetical protein CU044_6848 [Streptomyces sp. L-9-10]
MGRRDTSLKRRSARDEISRRLRECRTGPDLKRNHTVIGNSGAWISGSRHESHTGR